MNLIDLKVREFVEEVSSASPAPGGGSVSALMSIFGIALARMVGHLTINKKKFQKLDSKITDQFHQYMDTLVQLKSKLLPMIDADTQSFNRIMDAYQLPKDTEVEQAHRDSAIYEATLGAIEVPYQVAVMSLEALECLPFILIYGNPQTTSDIGVAALALASGIEGALYNVLINLWGLKNTDIVQYYQTRAATMLEKIAKIRNDLIDQVTKRLQTT